ncbi:uncharacterized protein LOC103842985 isoform X1 [Brassica rapa]|uniref:uncharacterized protein LOC103842985 isoform X1 n=2 Tax=Brassica campestris TaxID=3711 RepID=UPI0004F13EAD|nr:uncharacterized protein LOC103842985 isoform X1 [Brassica rapa]
MLRQFTKIVDPEINYSKAFQIMQARDWTHLTQRPPEASASPIHIGDLRRSNLLSEMARSQLSRSQRRRAQKKRAQKRRAPRIKSWRKKRPRLLCSIIIQIRAICWAIAFIRHYEFKLKLLGQMPLEEHLSIQALINHTPKRYLKADGTFTEDLSVLARVLQVNGTLLDRDCPLTERLDQAPIDDSVSVFIRVLSFFHFFLSSSAVFLFFLQNLQKFIPTKVRVHSIYPKRNSNFSQRRSDAMNAQLVKHVRGGCVAARIVVYPSYLKLEGKDIYYPTKYELDCLEPGGHVVLLTHYAYDANRRLYYQFQETAGVEVCDEGYAYVYADLVTHFLEIDA